MGRIVEERRRRLSRFHTRAKKPGFFKRASRDAKVDACARDLVVRVALSFI